MRTFDFIAINASDAVSQTSVAFDTQNIFRISALAVFGDATAAGSIKLQASNDFLNASPTSQGSFVPTNWVDIPSATATVTAGAKTLIPATEIAYRYVRIVFTQTTPGSTTVVVNVHGMGN